MDAYDKIRHIASHSYTNKGITFIADWSQKGIQNTVSSLVFEKKQNKETPS